MTSPDDSDISFNYRESSGNVVIIITPYLPTLMLYKVQMKNIY